MCRNATQNVAGRKKRKDWHAEDSWQPVAKGGIARRGSRGGHSYGGQSSSERAPFGYASATSLGKTNLAHPTGLDHCMLGLRTPHRYLSTMSKRAFSQSERFAVHVTHGEKCYLCSKPLDLQSMEVDHVVPETLEGNPIRLAQVLLELGRSSDFNIQSFANWLPACRRCNGKKLDTIFQPSLLVQLCLQRAAKHAAKAAAMAEELVTNRKISNALGVLLRADEKGLLSEEMKNAIIPLIEFQTTHRAPEVVGEPIRLSPLYEVLSDNGQIQIVRGPHGVGGRPTPRAGFSPQGCVSCGSIAAWNGIRCVICGQVDDD